MSRNLYAPKRNFLDGYVDLPAEEAFHAFKVLRAKPGDELGLIDGEGLFCKVVVESLEKESGRVRILERIENALELRIKVDLAIAPIKNRDRWEFAIEKTVELGVRSIIPIQTERTERPKINQTRLEAKIISALKQSGRSVKPEVNDLIALDELAQSFAEYDHVFLCSAYQKAASLSTKMSQIKEGQSVLLLIGPEGGFSESEAQVPGAEIVSLGERRLRTETAAIAAMTILSLSYSW